MNPPKPNWMEFHAAVPEAMARGIIGQDIAIWELGEGRQLLYSPTAKERGWGRNEPATRHTGVAIYGHVIELPPHFRWNRKREPWWRRWMKRRQR